MPVTGASSLRSRCEQQNFDRALRVDLSAHREQPNIFLTALSRVARWAGFYVRGHDAIGATVGFTILTGTAFISRCAPLISH